MSGNIFGAIGDYDPANVAITGGTISGLEELYIGTVKLEDFDGCLATNEFHAHGKGGVSGYFKMKQGATPAAHKEANHSILWSNEDKLYFEKQDGTDIEIPFVSGSSFWQRIETELSPQTAGDDVNLGVGKLLLGDAEIEHKNVTHDPIYLSDQIGLDDVSSSGIYSLIGNAVFQIRIQAVGTPDNFEWRKGTSGAWIGPIIMTGGSQLLQDGISIMWAATTGHTFKDEWEMNVGHEVHISESVHILGNFTIDNDLIVMGEIGSRSPNKFRGGILTDNIAERTTGAGVNISGLLIKDSATPQITIESDGTLLANTANYETLVTSDNDIPNKKYVDDASVNGLYNYTTGWLEGGVISINSGDNTKIDITAGSAVITDYTNPANPSIVLISWDEQIAYDPSLTIEKKDIGVRDNGSGEAEFVAEKDFDAVERRSIATLGRIWNPAGTQPIIIGIANYRKPTWGLLTAFQDFIIEYGSWNISGNVYSANGANLLFNKSAGKSYRYSTEDTIGQENVHSDDAILPVNTYLYHLQEVGVSEVLSSSSPDYWDDDGVKTALANNKWTVQEIWYFPVTGSTHVLYGQIVYSSKQAALDGITTENKVRNIDILNGAILRAYLVVEKGTTDLSDPVNEFREIIGIGGGSGGAAPLWQKNNGSVSPAITGDDVILNTGENISITDMTEGSIPFFGASGLITQDNINLFWDSATDKLGIGTNTVPRGGIGLAKVAIHGGNGSNGSTVQFTNSVDNYPLAQQLNWSHDDISWAFDCYYQNGWKSSDLGSNFILYKYQDAFQIQYDSGNSPGSDITRNTGFRMDSDAGQIDMPGIYGETTINGANVHVATDGSLRRSTVSGTPIESGAAVGQMAFWTGSTWAHTETTELFWDDVNKGLGIGASSVQGRLHIKLSGTGIYDCIRLETSQETGEDWYIYMPTSDNLVFRNDGVDHVVFAKDTGYVGIGVISPDSKLEVDGIVTATGFTGDLDGTINTATTATTQSPGDNSTKVATTAYADAISGGGVNVFTLYSESDLPTPVSGVCTLPSGKYVMKDAFSLTTIEEFQCVTDAVIEWTSEDKESHTLTHTTASKTLFNFTGGSRFKIEHASFFLTGNNTTFTNLTGPDFNSKFNDFRVIFTGTGGTVADILNTDSGTNEFVDGTIAGFTDGVTIENSAGIQILGLLLASDGTGTDALISIKNMSAIAINLNNNVFIGGASQSNFYIDPVIDVPVQIFDSNTVGSTTFFKSGTTGTFTQVVDSSVGATGITSVTDSGGIARFQFTAGPTLYVGQEVVISAFVTNTAYNGTYIIKTVGSGYFEIPNIPYGSDETGSFLSNSVTLVDIATALSEGDTVLLDTSLSTDYDGGSFVYNKEVNTVRVNMSWTADAAGVWNTGSLTEDSKYINSGNNGAQEPSFNISSVFVSGNAVTTSISGIGTFDSLNLGTASEGQSNSRFKMLDATTGLVEYTGLNDFNGKITVTLSAVRAGGTVDHKFRASKIIGSPAFDTITVTKGIGTITASVTLVTSVKLSPGDQFRVEVEAQSGTTEITVSDFSVVAD